MAMFEQADPLRSQLFSLDLSWTFTDACYIVYGWVFNLIRSMIFFLSTYSVTSIKYYIYLYIYYLYINMLMNIQIIRIRDLIE